MRIAEAVRTIGEFWECAPLPWAGGGVPHLERLEQAFSLTLPDELRTYIREFAPGRVVEFQGIGNPIALYGLEGDQRLGFEQLGYIDTALLGKLWKSGSQRGSCSPIAEAIR